MRALTLAPKQKKLLLINWAKKVSSVTVGRKEGMPLRASPLPREKVENLNLNGYLAKMYSLAIVCMRKRKKSRRSKILQSTLKIDLQTIM